MKGHNIFGVLLALVVILLPAAAAAQAQATITGQAVDPTGAAISNAKVRLLNLDSWTVMESQTKADGQFRFVNLRPGRYELTIEAAGFERARKEGISVAPAQNVETTVQLEVGRIADPAYIDSPEPLGTIKNFFRVNEQICTGGQPTMEELAQVKAQGVKAVINLRMPSEFNAEEEAAKAKELGLRYFHIPFDTNNPKDEAVDEFLKVVHDKQNRPLFIHCTTANRVGGFWMIYLVLVDDLPLQAAEEEAKKIGLHNPKTRAFALDYIARHQKKVGNS